MTNSKRQHVLITGGSGFIGSHLCDLFLARGYSVTAVDNFLTGRAENIAHLKSHPDFDFVKLDVAQPDQGRNPLSRERFRLIQRDGLFGVLHFACPASPIDFDKIPFEILQVDSAGTFHSVELALQFGARYLVASTSEIYGDPLVHPQKEDYWGNVNTLGPRACYDETKRFAEALVSTAIRGVGKWGGASYSPLNGAMVRIFNTYGPRMRPDDGRVVPELCVQALKGEELTLHGSGQQTRSFCFVSDLVEGIFKLFESDVKVPVNIGNPVERSILEFAQVVKKLTGSQSAIRHLPAREDDPKKRCPDITRARTLLGWQPKVDLEDGLRASLDYFKTEMRI